MGLTVPINAPFWGIRFNRLNGEQYQRERQKAHSFTERRHMTYRSSKSFHRGVRVTKRPKKNKKDKERNLTVANQVFPRRPTSFMMIMSGFLERVINSPQTRCRSAKQVGLRANVRGERVAVHCIKMKFCVVDDLQWIVFNFKFHQNRSAVSEIWELKVRSPVALACGLYNSLCCRSLQAVIIMSK